MFPKEGHTEAMTETKSTEAPAVVRRHHWWSEDRETIRTNILTHWRGERVTVETESDRYRTSDGSLTEWRHYVSAGWYGDEDSKYSSKEITDTARARLRDSVLPIAEHFVGTEEFVQSQTDSIVGEMRSLVSRLDSIYEVDRMIRKIEQHVGDADRRAKLIEAVEAYRNFQQAVGEVW